MPPASSVPRGSSTSPASCPTCLREELSDHLLSRLEVEQILATAATSVLTLRASMVVGAGSTSFEVMRQTSQRLGVVQTVPSWMGSSVIQPVAAADAVYYLAEAIERPEVTGHLDVVGPDQLTYLTLLRTYARAARLLRVQLPVWLAPVEVVARVAGRLVDVPAPVVESLIPSLGHDMVGRPRRRRRARRAERRTAHRRRGDPPVARDAARRQ